MRKIRRLSGRSPRRPEYEESSPQDGGAALQDRPPADRAGDEPWAARFHPPPWILREENYWPELWRRLEEARAGASLPSARRHPLLKWAAAGVTAAAFLVLWICQIVTPVRSPLSEFLLNRNGAPSADAPRIRVLSAEIQGEAARSSVFQTPDASFVWIYKAPPEGNLK